MAKGSLRIPKAVVTMLKVWGVTAVIFAPFASIDGHSGLGSIATSSVMFVADLALAAFGEEVLSTRRLYWPVSAVAIPSAWIWGIGEANLHFHLAGWDWTWIAFGLRGAILLAVIKCGVLIARTTFKPEEGVAGAGRDRA